MQPTINGASAPYRDPSANNVYELLFCDKPFLFAANVDAKLYPWNVLLANDVNINDLQEVIDDASLETRHKIFAYNKLTKAGYTLSKKSLLGVVIEVGLDNGLDVVAAYEDGTARYINATGKMIIWDTATTDSASLISNLFKQSRHVVQRIGAWDGERRPHPVEGMARLNFLVSDGLYFGEAPQAALFSDAMARPVLMAALDLMKYLTETVLEAAV